jgi:hypothetical protein
MTRFFITATYRTAGGNLGQCAFALMAATMDQAMQLAARRVSIRGRSKFNITVQLEA